MRAQLLTCALVLIACRRNVPQDRHTGPDGAIEGARPLVFDGARAFGRGIVSYPAGDRVDWWKLTVPARGKLDLELRWRTPRPGLRLAFEVFDAWGYSLAASRRSSRLPVRTTTLDARPGDLFVRVYAIERGDAGDYTLAAKLVTPRPSYDWSAVAFDTELSLPEVPPVDFVCTSESFDLFRVECKDVCPSAGAPKGWPACKSICPTPPEVENPACWHTMPCPNPPDRRIRACLRRAEPCSRPDDLVDDRGLACPGKPVFGRIIAVEVEGAGTIVKIGVGRRQGVARDWRAALVPHSGSDLKVAGGEITIVRVDDNVTVGRLAATPDQVRATPHVRLERP